MARKPASKAAPTRRRRTSEEARNAILDAAEQRLVASGPAGIRLQEVAADVGLSHPTVLHHFGSREGLLKAVVARALDSLQNGLVDAVRTLPEGPGQVAAMLDRVNDTMVRGGNARSFLWLALSGYGLSTEELRVRSVAEVVHEVRRTRRTDKKKRMPPFEDTFFTVLLPALALVALAVVDPDQGNAGPHALGADRFRAWLGRLIQEHLEKE